MYEWLDSIFPFYIYIIFALGFLLLIKGADWLVDGAAAIAHKFDVSDLVIGLTIVSFGTSAPELVVNIIASLADKPDIAIGNILGSNVANVLLILGVTVLIRPLGVLSTTVWKEIPFSMLAALMVGVLTNDIFFGNSSDTNILSRGDGIVLIAFFVVFLYYAFGLALRGEASAMEEEAGEHGDMPLPKAILLTTAGLLALPLGGDWIVRGSVHIARVAGLSEAVISLTIIAIGTSLPEVAASVTAALKGKVDIAVGNAVGSNIFNVFWVLGLSSTIKPLPFSAEVNRDVAMAVLASFLLFLAVVTGKRRSLERYQGIIFILIYATYLVYLVMFASGDA